MKRFSPEPLLRQAELMFCGAETVACFTGQHPEDLRDYQQTRRAWLPWVPGPTNRRHMSTVTDEDLAVVLGTNRNEVHWWRNGRSLNAATADRCATALGLHPSDIWVEWSHPLATLTELTELFGRPTQWLRAALNAPGAPPPARTRPAREWDVAAVTEWLEAFHPMADLSELAEAA